MYKVAIVPIMMHLSAKGEYGVLAILALCLNGGQDPVQVKTIAHKERIPLKFLEQVMNLLKRQGLVESVRGPHGGYRLSRSPEQIRLGEVLQAIEGPMIDPMLSHQKASPASDGKVVLSEAWVGANASMQGHLDSISFQDLCDRKKRLEKVQTLMFHI